MSSLKCQTLLCCICVWGPCIDVLDIVGVAVLSLESGLESGSNSHFLLTRTSTLICFFIMSDKRRSILPVYPVSMCLVCKHYRKAQRCEAFPLRIPQTILIGKYDHRKPHQGDHSIKFQPKEGVSKDELKAILGVFDSEITS
jgi:hypothetical protein